MAERIDAMREPRSRRHGVRRAGQDPERPDIPPDSPVESPPGERPPDIPPGPPVEYPEPSPSPDIPPDSPVESPPQPGL